MNKTLILIDGHALAFRQYYALERSNMRISDGTPSWAVYGFFKAIFDLLKNQNIKPDAVCVAFDVSHQTFRVKKYAEYKANREAMPDNMRCQMNLIYEGLKAFNIPIYTKEGYEADDVIGSISKQACEQGHSVLILTGDQDAFQLIDKENCVKVIIPSKGVLSEFGWDNVYEKLGVYPNQVVDYKSLRGDTSDNIPGVKGIGEKTAVKLLSEYGSLENILNACDTMPENNIKKCLCNDIEMAKLSYFLATIVKDLDIDFDIESAQINLPNVVAVSDFLRKMQFYSFLKNIDSVMNLFNKNSNDVEVSNEVVSNGAQLGLFAETIKNEINKQDFNNCGKIITELSDLDELVTILKTKKVFAFRTEAVVKNVLESNIIGITIAYNDDFGVDDGIIFNNLNSVTNIFYLPLKHDLEKQISVKDFVAKLRPVFEDESIKKITHDVKQEYNCLKTYNIETKGFIFDTYLASYIKSSSRNHNLDVQTLENINRVIEDISDVKGIKNAIRILDLRVDDVLEYVSDVLSSIFELVKYWIENLSNEEKHLLYNIELPLAIILANMEQVGVSVDLNYLNVLSKEMADTLRTVEFEIYAIAGEAFNINSPKQVGEVLFEKLGLTYKKRKTKGKYSTSAEVLEELAQENEIARLILIHRKFSKLKSTYTDALVGLINPMDNRIHTTYNQTITATGRLSSSNPNLQNIPVRSEDGSKIRKAFVPENDDGYILSADYSQIELRLLAHVSGDKNLIEAFKSGEDVHTLTASKIFDVPISEVTKDMRYKAKAVNFGIVYGQSKYGLAKSLNITPSEAENFINKYFETYPDIKSYMEKMTEYVQKNGYVQSMFGRRRYLQDEMNSSNGILQEFAKRAAINHPMQSSAADLIKMAMIRFNDDIVKANLKSKMIIQVHDELVVEVANGEQDIVQKMVVEAMELGQPLALPLVVDVNIGKTWQEL